MSLRRWRVPCRSLVPPIAVLLVGASRAVAQAAAPPRASASGGWLSPATRDVPDCGWPDGDHPPRSLDRRRRHLRWLVVTRGDGERLPKLLDRFVQQPDVEVDVAQSVVRVIQVRVEGYGAPVPRSPARGRTGREIPTAGCLGRGGPPRGATDRLALGGGVR